MSIWSLVYDGFDPHKEPLREALCTVGNGYFATRGAAPESVAGGIHYPGTYAGGIYNRLTSEVQGRTIENEDIVNLPNWLVLTFRTEDGDWFDLEKVELLEYRQELDLRQGLLTRFVRFRDAAGRQTRLSQRRFVHMAYPHLACLETTLVAENWSGRLCFHSGIDGRVTNSGVARYRQLNNRHLSPIDAHKADQESLCLRMETNQSHIRIGQAIRTRLFQNGGLVEPQRDVINTLDYIAHEFPVEVRQGDSLTVEKVAALYTSRDYAISESGLEACKAVVRAEGFDHLLERHALSWEHLWGELHISVDIEDDQRSAMVLNLHMFHLLQTVSRNTIELDAGVPPRGLHGEAYRGHIFWDELFIFPFLNLRLPELTRSLLMYRYRRLPEARWAARQAGYQGAMFPWQSGSNGREESQTWHLNPRSGRWIPDSTRLQRHINIAIAHNVWQYYQVTGDVDFMAYHGAELIIETARFWASIAEYNGEIDRYEIRGVMGPDEYHEAYPGSDVPGLNNNAYTNVMVVWVLCRAMKVLEVVPAYRCVRLWEDLGLRKEELEEWEDISRKMRVVFHDDGIISQFEGYDKLEEFDWEGYQRKYGDIQRLDRILEAEGDTPNRYKASKQADVLMLCYLLSSEELGKIFHRLGYPFDHETIPDNIEYYLSRTSHGSTLSRVVHSCVLARSQRQQSWEFFKDALESDVSDIQGGTTSEGIHLGAMAGTVEMLQHGYTGMNARGDVLWFNPSLPPPLKSLDFEVRYRHHWINVHITRDRLRVGTRPSEAACIKVGFNGQVVELEPGHTTEFELQRGGPEEHA